MEDYNGSLDMETSHLLQVQASHLVRATPTLSSQCLKKVLNSAPMDKRTQLDIQLIQLD